MGLLEAADNRMDESTEIAPLVRVRGESAFPETIKCSGVLCCLGLAFCQNLRMEDSRAGSEVL